MNLSPSQVQILLDLITDHIKSIERGDTSYGSREANDDVIEDLRDARNELMLKGSSMR